MLKNFTIDLTKDVDILSSDEQEEVEDNSDKDQNDENEEIHEEYNQPTLLSTPDNSNLPHNWNLDWDWTEGDWDWTEGDYESGEEKGVKNNVMDDEEGEQQQQQQQQQEQEVVINASHLVRLPPQKSYKEYNYDIVNQRIKDLNKTLEKMDPLHFESNHLEELILIVESYRERKRNSEVYSTSLKSNITKRAKT